MTTVITTLAIQFTLILLNWIILIFSHLKFSRYRDPQLQVCENYWYLFNLTPNICIPNNSDLISE